ncbi:hypothetical protein V2J09_011932 [Rumex salicifolius]
MRFYTIEVLIAFTCPAISMEISPYKLSVVMLLLLLVGQINSSAIHLEQPYGRKLLSMNKMDKEEDSFRMDRVEVPWLPPPTRNRPVRQLPPPRL